MVVPWLLPPLAALVMLLVGCAGQRTADTSTLSAPELLEPSSQNLPALSIDSIRLTAAGHYVDLRYRVLDPGRANAVLGPDVKPLLIDEATGTRMAVPTTAKLGSLRQTQGDQRPNRTYFVLFVNSAPLRAGSIVTAELGDFRFEHLTVE
jgi:hypothetical protein